MLAFVQILKREKKKEKTNKVHLVKQVEVRGQVKLRKQPYFHSTTYRNVMHKCTLKARLQWLILASASMLASYLINWDYNPFLEQPAWFIKKSKQFNQSDNASDITTLFSVKRALRAFSHRALFDSVSDAKKWVEYLLLVMHR